MKGAGGGLDEPAFPKFDPKNAFYIGRRRIHFGGFGALFWKHFRGRGLPFWVHFGGLGGLGGFWLSTASWEVSRAILAIETAFAGAPFWDCFWGLVEAKW